MFTSVVQAIFAHAKKDPSKLCVADDVKALSYDEYVKKILKISNYLKSLNVKKGDKILVEASQTVDFLALETAVHLLGAIFVPFIANCHIQKIISFIKKVTPSLVILNRFDNERQDCITVSSLTINSVIENADNYECLTNFSFPQEHDVSEILFTTGSTGDEKGIMISFANNVAIAENVIHGVLLKNDNVEFILSPFNHSHGLRRYYANMLQGASVIMQNSVVYIKNIFDKSEKYHVNSMDMVPSALTLFLKLSKDHLAKYQNSMRYIQLGAAPILEGNKEKLRKLLPKTKLYNMYGSTESGVSCVYEFSSDTKANCIGQPAYNSIIFVVDDQRREIKSSREHPGYLACKSKANMLSYYGTNTQSVTDVLQNGIVYSNDIVYFDDDGALILLGRRGSIINIGGHKVSPLEIESVAVTYEGINDCACIPVNDEELGQVPKLFIQLNSNKEAFNEEDLRKYLSCHIAYFMMPKFIEIIDKIPRTNKGSLKRELLK